MLYVCLVALLAITTIQAIHVCNLQLTDAQVSSQGGEASPVGSFCPICLAVYSATAALVYIIIFSPSLRRDFVAVSQPFHFVELPTSFQLSVRPPPACC